MVGGAGEHGERAPCQQFRVVPAQPVTHVVQGDDEARQEGEEPLPHPLPLLVVEMAALPAPQHPEVASPARGLGQVLHHGCELAIVMPVDDGRRQVEAVGQRAHQQLLLAAEVPVERAGGDPDRAGDVLGAHVVITETIEQFTGSSDDLSSAVAWTRSSRDRPSTAMLTHCPPPPCRLTRIPVLLKLPHHRRQLTARSDGNAPSQTSSPRPGSAVCRFAHRLAHRRTRWSC